MENNKRYNFKSEAILKYSHGEFDIITPGDYVICAVTGNSINIEDLKYWNVDKQEAYESADIALKRYKNEL
ncbi:DUF2093 domain-containing protein [Hyphomicrobiales bacterium]|jgi:hypothetical protein|nr:DUF2093 domain-containing protein [Rhodobiaceae bacterium]MBT6223071.1 DUF2093 domain-containing protein [Rhodobiaceae bacterium]MDB4128006.1 DUF2093 domain-containing protein [Hyphomicrobiales bacterium]MDB4831704.1 DUF2093 domain-containing protein [Hyphomicrobiales bacterium]MDC3272688.1 DUF2093 domain-containing protein [Hyphomicrobiales bacterium]|tara:strand:- start:3278 stop:3490 length:213 start_codon:yes stop_codon:yes gene_type:complete